MRRVEPRTALIALAIAIACSLSVISAILLARSQIHGEAPVVTVADSIPRVPGNKLAIDVYRVSGVPLRDPFVVPRNGVLEIEGWAFDAAAFAPGQGVVGVIDDSHDYVAAYGRQRPDVAAAMHDAALARTGFLLQVPASSLRSGKHRLTYLVIAADGTKAYIAGSTAFTVR